MNHNFGLVVTSSAISIIIAADRAVLATPPSAERQLVALVLRIKAKSKRRRFRFRRVARTAIAVHVTLDLSAHPAALSEADATAAVLAQMGDWHPALRRLVETADEPAITAFAVKTSVPIQPWDTQRVTLLGDALHNMTPFRGIGANVALRDAAALRRALVSVARGEARLKQALAAYERDMIEYGFAAVQASLKNMKRFHAKGKLARSAVRSLFRMIDHVPPLKSAFLGR